MVVNRHKIRIEWGDCDPAGIVYYPRYFEYFDTCTAALFESAGLPKRTLFETYGIAGIPMVDTRANFIAPSTFGDDVIVESTITGYSKVKSSQRKVLRNVSGRSGCPASPTEYMPKPFPRKLSISSRLKRILNGTNRRFRSWLQLVCQVSAPSKWLLRDPGSPCKLIS